MKHLLLTLVLLVTTNIMVIAAPSDTTTTPQPRTRVSLLTCAPGREIYELEGHSALRLQMPDGRDLVVNWGLFDFGSPGFVYRFVKGETDYSVGICPFTPFLLAYTAEHRLVTEQLFNLTSQQADRVVELVMENLSEEHRHYRYNYVLDNCATRPIRIIEQAIGDSICFNHKTFATTEAITYRSMMRRYHTNYPWYQLGIDIALGPGIDQPITPRQAIFAPAALCALASQATIGSPQGPPLVHYTRALTSGYPKGVPLPPTPWYLTPLWVFIALSAVTLAISIHDYLRHRITRWFDALLFGTIGLAGCIVAFLVTVSTHQATTPNWQLLWINPLCLLMPILIWCSSTQRILAWWQAVYIALILVYCITWLFSSQSGNIALLPVIVACLMRSTTYLQIYRESNPAI